MLIEGDLVPIARGQALVFFVRSGDIKISNGRLRDAGITGYGWSSRAYSTATNAYSLYFGSANVYPSYNSHRWHGFPLRCLSTAVD